MDDYPFGPGGMFAHLQAFGGGMGPGMGHRGNPRSYDEHMKAYSVAMMPGKERLNVSYGGKIIMPPSALAALTQLDVESPWQFQLRNPRNAAASTHAGVLEFIAEEGCVYLPYWMMKTLRLNEGDAVRLTGTTLPKGKFVKLQAQTVDFLEVSDPKAVLEQALRNFTTLTQGDIIEISYNAITFNLLIMETKPEAEGILVLDTDLEVDFAAPLGYKEPERAPRKPPPSMATKLNIDVNGSTPGNSRPGSALGGAFAGAGGGVQAISKSGHDWEAFKGKGETLAGRKTKGKGVSVRKIDDQQEDSKIFRTDKTRIVSNDTYNVETKVPAALNLPPGRLFFGYRVVPYEDPEPKKEDDEPEQEPEASSSAPKPFTGSGNKLTGPSSSSKSRSTRGATPSASTPAPSASKSPPPEAKKPEPKHDWGKGNSLKTGGGLSSKSAPKKKERSPTPDYGVDDDEIIDIDSD